MKRKETLSELIYGVCIFIGVLPMSFISAQGETNFLLYSSYKELLWIGEILVLGLLIIGDFGMSARQQMSLVFNFISLPLLTMFAGIFALGQIIPTAFLSWAIGCILLYRWTEKRLS